MASIKQNKQTKKWEFVFDRYVDGKRKQVRRRGFKTKREAQDKLLELETEVKKDEYVEPSVLTVSQFMTEWIESRKGKMEEITVYNNESYLKNHVTPFFGELKMQEVSPRLCQRFIDEMINKGYAFNTVDRVSTMVKMAFDRAVTFKMIKQNYMRMVEMPLRTKKEMKVWNAKELNRFLNYAKDNCRYYCVYAIALMTGMRQGEILGLRWKDVDLDNNLFYIRQILTHYGKDFKLGAKTISGNRTITIPDKLVGILKAERKKVTELKLKSSEWHDLDLVICANNGNRIFPANLTRQFKKDIISADVPDIRFHDMRHTHATMLIEKNVNVKVISERLGHSKIGITLDTYSHVLPSMQQEAADQINKVIN